MSQCCDMFNVYNSQYRHKSEKAQTTSSNCNQVQASSAHIHQPVQLQSGYESLQKTALKAGSGNISRSDNSQSIS